MIAGFVKQGWARFVFSDASEAVGIACERNKVAEKNKQEQLGIAFNTSLIMNSFLHGEERIKLIAQYETNDNLTTILSESISNGEIRGFLDESPIKEKAPNQNFLKVSKILYNHYQEVSGYIKLNSNSLTSEDIYNYFDLSEQIKTHVDFNHSSNSDEFISQGFILQKMPECDLDRLQKLFNDILQSPYYSNIKNSRLNASRVYQLFKDLGVEVECRRTPVQFYCRCSIGQFLTIMKSLGEESILDMREKNQRTLTCQMCKKGYIMQDSDFESLLNSFKQAEKSKSS
jgi:molecular chaperone Hsp33